MVWGQGWQCNGTEMGGDGNGMGLDGDRDGTAMGWDRTGTGVWGTRERTRRAEGPGLSCLRSHGPGLPLHVFPPPCRGGNPNPPAPRRPCLPGELCPTRPGARPSDLCLMSLLSSSAKSHWGQLASVGAPAPPCPPCSVPFRGLLPETSVLPDLCLDPVPSPPGTHPTSWGFRRPHRTCPAPASPPPHPLAPTAGCAHSQTSGRNPCPTLPSPKHPRALSRPLTCALDPPPAQSPKLASDPGTCGTFLTPGPASTQVHSGPITGPTDQLRPPPPPKSTGLTLPLRLMGPSVGQGELSRTVHGVPIQQSVHSLKCICVTPKWIHAASLPPQPRWDAHRCTAPRRV